MSSAARLGLLVALLASGLARVASAQTGLGGATGTTALTADDLLIVVQGEQGAALSDFDLQRFFNISNCQCQTPVFLYFTFTQSGFAKKPTIGTGSIEFWIGLNCNNISIRSCKQLGSLPLTTFAANSGYVIATDVQTLSQSFGQPPTATAGDGGLISGTPGPSGAAACQTQSAFGQNIWANLTLSDGIPNSVSATLQVNVDLAPPPTPVPSPNDDKFGITGGNEAVIANWTTIDSAAYPDLLGYQVLCDRGGELQVFRTGSFTAGYKTCNTNPLPSSEFDINVNGLDPNYVCSPLLSATTSSYRVKILENGVNYGVAVVAIDTHYNPSQPQVHYGAPKKTLSFYDVYRNGDSANTGPGNSNPEPGRATGGYCAVGGATSRAAGLGGLGVVIAGAALVLAARRRRGRRGRR